MEFLNGHTLKEAIRRDGPFPLSRVVEIMRQVGSALEAAHAEGVVHRDLKSENIMLINAGGADYAKVLDFGIAKIQEPLDARDSGLTSPDLIIGTPQYMSPEQCSQAEEIDARSDIYSLGVILFEMLLGHVPFVGESPTAIMLKHLQEAPPSVLDVRSDLPAGVETIVSRALAKRREDRYQRVGDLVEDLVIAGGTGLVQADARVMTPRVTTGIAGQQNSSGEAPTDLDEVTVVRQRPAAPTPGVPATPTQPRQASPVSGFNPWRILLPSSAALLVVFAVIFAFTRNNQAPNPAQQGQSPTLSADPNGQAVKPASPPTGKSEQGIPLGGVTNPGATVNNNVNANVTISPTPLANENGNVNTSGNENRAANTNVNRAPEVPLPKATPQASPKATNPPLPSPETAKPLGTPPPTR